MLKLEKYQVRYDKHESCAYFQIKHMPWNQMYKHFAPMSCIRTTYLADWGISAWHVDSSSFIMRSRGGFAKGQI